MNNNSIIEAIKGNYTLLLEACEILAQYESDEEALAAFREWLDDIADALNTTEDVKQAAYLFSSSITTAIQAIPDEEIIALRV